MSVVPNQWPSNSKGYKIMNSIGCGYFGTVWRAEVLEGKHKGEIVAIKMIELDRCADDKISGIRVKNFPSQKTFPHLLIEKHASCQSS
jgi:hypothetical protein